MYIKIKQLHVAGQKFSTILNATSYKMLRYANLSDVEGHSVLSLILSRRLTAFVKCLSNEDTNALKSTTLGDFSYLNPENEEMQSSMGNSALSN